MHDDALGDRQLPGAGAAREGPRGDDVVVRPRGVRDARLRPARAGWSRCAATAPVRCCTSSTPRRCDRSTPSTCPTARSPTSSRGRTSAAAPTSTSTPEDRAVVATTDRRILTVDSDGLEQVDEVDLGRRGTRRRLPGRAAARLGGQHLVRHPGRPGRRGRRHRRPDPARPRRRDRQLDRGRRHRGLPGDHRGASTRSRSTTHGQPAVAVAGGVRQRHARRSPAS